MIDAEDSALARQWELEASMRERGIARARRLVSRKVDRGQEATTPYGSRLTRLCLENLTSAVRAYLDRALGGSPGRSATGAVRLSVLEADVVSAITMKVLLNQITRQRGLTAAALALGAAIEDEVRIRAYEESRPALLRVVLKDLEARSTSYTYKRRKLAESARRAGVEWEGWGQRDRLLVGTALIDLAIESTGLVTQKVVHSDGRKKRILLASKVTMQAVRDITALSEALKPEYYPTLIAPRDWDGPFGGGYWTHHLDSLPLVKTDNKAYLEELAHFEMPLIYGGVNALQRTAWKVNRPVLDVLQAVWDEGIALPSLPPSENEAIPEKPADIATNKAARTAWKRAAVVIHTENNRLDSRRLLLRKTIEVAHLFRGEEEFYMPWQLDFRSRAYAVPGFLTPQGPDFAKGLLTFAKGKAIGEQGACYLAIHGANCYGHDKVGLQDRIDWVQARSEDIRQIAADPLSHINSWAYAAEPFQYLAFCYEWAGWLDTGEGYVSHLPVSADGSANGLQHYAAMLRSATTGREVNLIPSEKPQDIYQKVADAVEAKLGSPPRKDDEVAQKWLAFGIRRGACKRPCMVLPYGGRQFSFGPFILDWLQEEKERGSMHPFGADEVFGAATYLAGVMWEAIGEVVHAATDAMAWLQAAARVATSEGLPIRWDTPCNFPVLQRYLQVKPYQIRTKLLGTTFKPALYKSTGKLDKARQANGVAPNFVHSIDASHMFITIDVAKQLGIDAFAMVHDSYGTHAADAELLWYALRKAFVEMYKQADVLADFRDALLDVLPAERHQEVGALPPRGSLDIDGVEQAEFFFA